MKRRTLLLATALAAAGFAQAQSKPTTADLGAYAGADREQKLAEGAKKEGELNIYTSAQSDDMGALVAAFEKKYGLKVNVWRSSSEKVLQRAVQEARGNRHTMDVAETNGPEMEAMSREKILQKVSSPYLKDLIEQAIEVLGGGQKGVLSGVVWALNHPRASIVEPDDIPADEILDVAEPYLGEVDPRHGLREQMPRHAHRRTGPDGGLPPRRLHLADVVQHRHPG